MSDQQAEIRFEMLINGEKKCISGVDLNSVLVQSISYHPNAQDRGEESPAEPYIDLDLMGNNKKEHLEWHWQTVKAGDEIKIRVLGPGPVDPPTARRK